MGVLLHAGDDSRPSAVSKSAVSDLTCIWQAQSVDGKLCRLRCSAHIERLTGHSQQSFQDNSSLNWHDSLWFQIVHPDDRLAYRAAWLRLERGEEFDIEHRIVRADGQTRWVRSHALPADEASGSAASGLITDITDRKRADEEQAQLHLAIQCASAEWRLMFDAADTPMLMVDAAGTVLRLNQAVQRHTGRSSEDCL